LHATKGNEKVTIIKAETKESMETFYKKKIICVRVMVKRKTSEMMDKSAPKNRRKFLTRKGIARMKPKEYKLKDKHLEYFSVSVFHIQIEIASTSADYFRRGMSSKQFFYPPKKPNQTKLQRHSAQPKQTREKGKWQETGPEIIG